MDMIDAYKRGMHLYADFTGRATRKEFWLYVLAAFLICVSTAVVETAILGGLTGGALILLVQLIHLVPSLAVAARRLHDTDKSALWLLLMAIPLIGHIILIVFYCTKSDPAPNRFG